MSENLKAANWDVTKAVHWVALLETTKAGSMETVMVVSKVASRAVLLVRSLVDCWADQWAVSSASQKVGYWADLWVVHLERSKAGCLGERTAEKRGARMAVKLVLRMVEWTGSQKVERSVDLKVVLWGENSVEKKDDHSVVQKGDNLVAATELPMAGQWVRQMAARRASLRAGWKAVKLVQQKVVWREEHSAVLWVTLKAEQTVSPMVDMWA